LRIRCSAEEMTVTNWDVANLTKPQNYKPERNGPTLLRPHPTSESNVFIHLLP